MFRRSIKLIRREGRRITLSTTCSSFIKSKRPLTKNFIECGSGCALVTPSSQLHTSSHFCSASYQNTNSSGAGAGAGSSTSRCQDRSYTTAPKPYQNNRCFIISPSSSLHTRTFKNHQRTIRRGKVFVSRHNQSLNVTSSQIVDYCRNQGIANDDLRTTSTHVILRECPFCNKPTGGKADNMYKIYVQIGGGAYFCHRCGELHVVSC